VKRREQPLLSSPGSSRALNLERANSPVVKDRDHAAKWRSKARRAKGKGSNPAPVSNRGRASSPVLGNNPAKVNNPDKDRAKARDKVVASKLPKLPKARARASAKGKARVKTAAKARVRRNRKASPRAIPVNDQARV